MSLRAMQWALDQTEATGSAKAVLIILAFRMNDSRGNCYPGITRIAHDAGLCRDTVVRAIGALVEHGLLAVEKRAGSGEGRQTNRYTFPSFQLTLAKSDHRTLHKGGQSLIQQGAKSDSAGGKV